MKQLVRFTLAGLFVFACATVDFAQRERMPAPAPKPMPVPGAGFTEEPAIVYIYRTRQAKTTGKATLAVFVNGKMIASLDGGRYLVANMEEGTYTFGTTKKKEGGVEVNLMGGNTYYISLTDDSGVTVGTPRIKVVAEGEGASAVRQLKPMRGRRRG